MPNVSDYIGQSYQRYSTGARFTVPPDPQPPYDPGLVESDQGVVFYLKADGELIDVAGGSAITGPEGPQGPPGPQGPAGPAGEGTGSISFDGPEIVFTNTTTDLELFRKSGQAKVGDHRVRVMAEISVESDVPVLLKAWVDGWVSSTERYLHFPCSATRMLQSQCAFWLFRRNVNPGSEMQVVVLKGRLLQGQIPTRVLGEASAGWTRTQYVIEDLGPYA